MASSLLLAIAVLAVIVTNGFTLKPKFMRKQATLTMSSSTFNKAISSIAISTIAFTFSNPFNALAVTKTKTAVPETQQVVVENVKPNAKFVEEIAYDNFVAQKKILSDKKSVLSSSISALNKEISIATNDFQKELNQLNEVNTKLKTPNLDSSMRSSLNSLRKEYNKEVNAALAVKKGKVTQLERSQKELKLLNKQIKENDENIKKSLADVKTKREQRIKSEKEETARKEQKNRDKNFFDKQVSIRKATAIIDKEQNVLDKALKEELKAAKKIKDLATQEKKEKDVVSKLSKRISDLETEYPKLKGTLDKEVKSLKETDAKLNSVKASSAVVKEVITNVKGELGIAKKNLQAIQSIRI